MAAVLLLHCRKRDTGDLGDTGAGDVPFGHHANRGVEGPRYLVTVHREEASLDVLRARSRRSRGQVPREGRRWRAALPCRVG